jgi:hypothetical protein
LVEQGGGAGLWGRVVGQVHKKEIRELLTVNVPTNTSVKYASNLHRTAKPRANNQFAPVLPLSVSFSLEPSK